MYILCAHINDYISEIGASNQNSLQFKVDPDLTFKEKPDSDPDPAVKKKADPDPILEKQLVSDLIFTPKVNLFLLIYYMYKK